MMWYWRKYLNTKETWAEKCMNDSVNEFKEYLKDEDPIAHSCWTTDEKSQ